MLRPSTVAVRPTWLKRKERAGSQVRRVPLVRRKRVRVGEEESGERRERRERREGDMLGVVMRGGRRGKGEGAWWW